MASDTSDIPAGFFTTFSISDPNGLTPETFVRTQRRNRRVFVCIPCHRRKLKCDKLLPCSRCLAVGNSDECCYQPPPSNSSNSGRKTRKGTRHDSKSGSSPADSLGSPYSSSSHDPYSFRSTPGSKTTNGTSLGSNEDDEWEVSQPLVKPLKGVSHWTRIACEFEEAMPYVFGTEPQWQERYRQVKNLECLFATINDNSNFPFGTSFCSKDQVLRSFPPNQVIDTLVSNYLNTFGATYCLFHPSQLQYNFDTAVSDEWLAEFCMVLGLGAETASDFLFSGLAQSASAWTGTFLSAAQASFGRSLYMTAPSLSTVRTLCMMVIAKLAEMPGSGGSPGGNWTYAPLVSLMALTVQTAKALQLHRSAAVEEPPLHIEQHDSLEAEMRRRIWVTVRLLDLETALRSGTAMQSDTGDAEPPRGHATADVTADSSCNSSEIFNFSIGCMHGGMCKEVGCLYSGTGSSAGSSCLTTSTPDYDGLYLNKLSSFLPLLASVVNTVNSPTKPSPLPQRVAACGARVQKHFQEFSVNHVNHGEEDARTDSQIYRSTLQMQHLEMTTHRVLLALYHDTFCDSISSVSPASFDTASVFRSAAIESAHALLVIQKSLVACTTLGSVSSSSSAPSHMDSPFSLLQPALQPGPPTYATTWMLDLCHDNFAIAMEYLMMALRTMHSQDQEDNEDDGNNQDSTATAEAVEMAETAISACLQVLRDRSCRSVAQFNEYNGISIFYACMRGLQSGDLLSEVVRATNEVEQVVMDGRRDVLWAANNYPPDNGLMFGVPLYTLS